MNWLFACQPHLPLRKNILRQQKMAHNQIGKILGRRLGGAKAGYRRMVTSEPTERMPNTSRASCGLRLMQPSVAVWPAEATGLP